jgi:hypothetical protein
MDAVKRWWLRGTAAVSGAVLALLLPAVAWAHANPAVYAVGEELVARRPRGRGGFGFGFLGLICCLVVVALVVGAIVLSRRRGRRS